MKSPAMRFLGMAVWLITALGCIHIGAMALGYDAVTMFGLVTMNMTIMYILGIAGLISLIMFIMHAFKHMGGHCDCC